MSATNQVDLAYDDAMSSDAAYKKDRVARTAPESMPESMRNIEMAKPGAPRSNAQFCGDRPRPPRIPSALPWEPMAPYRV